MKDGVVEISTDPKAPSKFHLFEDFERSTHKVPTGDPSPVLSDQPVGPFRIWSDSANFDDYGAATSQLHIDRGSFFTMRGFSAIAPHTLSARVRGSSVGQPPNQLVLPRVAFREPWYVSMRGAFSNLFATSRMCFGFLRSPAFGSAIYFLDDAGPNYALTTSLNDRCMMGFPTAFYSRPDGIAHVRYDVSNGLNRDSNSLEAATGVSDEDFIIRDGELFTMSMISDGHGIDFLFNGKRRYRATDFDFISPLNGASFMIGLSGGPPSALTLLHIDYIEIECNRTDDLLPS